MAKRGRRRGGVDAAGIGTGEPAVAGGVEAAGTRSADTLGDFAEDLGRLLGTAQSKAAAWLDQRKAIAEQLTQIRDTANRYLQELTGGGANMAVAVRRGRRGRPPGSGAAKRGPGRPAGAANKKRTMSPEARERIAAAQRARWAKQKAAGGKR